MSRETDALALAEVQKAVSSRVEIITTLPYEGGVVKIGAPMGQDKVVVFRVLDEALTRGPGDLAFLEAARNLQNVVGALSASFRKQLKGADVEVIGFLCYPSDAPVLPEIITFVTNYGVRVLPINVAAPTKA